MIARGGSPGAALLALPLCALGLLALVPTSPLHSPLSWPLAAPIGAAVGAVLFLALAGAARRTYVPAGWTMLGAGVVVGASEEVVWRGFALARLAFAVGTPGGIALSTLGFALSHYPAQHRRGVAVQLGTGVVFGGLFALSGSLAAAISAHGAYNVLALLARPSALPATAAAASVTPALALRGVAKRFGSAVALDGVDVVVSEGKVVALLGPNGAGKTTLVSIVLGLRRADAGEVRIFGARPSSRGARPQVAATPQEMSFPPTLRVREIVDFVRAHHSAAEPRRDLLARFGLEDVANRQVGGISGGQRRRLALALAFAGNPRLVMLDEPTTGLDVESRRALWDAIRAYAAGGGTVLLTTHYLEEAQALAERIVVLRSGRIVAEGSPDELRGDGSLEDAYLRLTGAGE